MTSIPKMEDLKAHSPTAGGSSSPSAVMSQNRKRPIERVVNRVPRKLTRAEGVSVPTNLDPRLMTLCMCLSTITMLWLLLKLTYS